MKILSAIFILSIATGCNSQNSPKEEEGSAISKQLLTGGNNNQSSGNDPSNSGSNSNDSSSSGSGSNGNGNNENGSNSGEEDPHELGMKIDDIKNFLIVYNGNPEFADSLLAGPVPISASAILNADFLNPSEELSAALNQLKVSVKPILTSDQITELFDELLELQKIAFELGSTIDHDTSQETVLPNYLAINKSPHRILFVAAVEDAIAEYFTANGFSPEIASAKLEVKNTIETNLATIDSKGYVQPHPQIDWPMVSAVATAQIYIFLVQNFGMTEEIAKNHATALEQLAHEKVGSLAEQN